MHRFKKLLIFIGGDSAEPAALARAAELARRDGVALGLVAVVEPFPWYTRLLLPASEEIQGILTGDKGRRLELLATPLRSEGLQVTTAVLKGRASFETVREVLRGGYDLVVKEAEPGPGILFGSTDMHLLRDCPCPVWLVKPEHGDRPFSRVLAAVDPEPPADETDILHLKTELGPKDPALDTKILELAGSLASGEGAELHILHTWSAPGEGLLRRDATLAAQGQVERYVEDSHEEARKALEHLLAGSPTRTDRRFVHLIKGDPADVIAEFAKTGRVDLIVMGTVARTGIPGFLIGNTAETVLQRVDCSVLAVKPDGFISPVTLGA
jgi:nucleotide-binding universal stress UspA family protein